MSTEPKGRPERRFEGTPRRRRRSLRLAPVWALLVACLATTLGGCGGRRRDQPRALVLIVIDTLRGDRLGCTGYEPARTPVLDSLATTGVLFRQAMTPAPLTLVAVSSLFTGRWPFDHGVRDNAHFVLPDGEVTLAERFRDDGWRTGGVISCAVLAAESGVDAGFEIYEDSFDGPYPIYDPTLLGLRSTLTGNRLRADRVTDRALEILDDFGDERFFLFVHYFDVHAVYDPPPEYAAMHPGRPYDGEVTFVDHEIGRLLRALENRGDAMVVVVADHGESQGEHGEPQHGLLVYQSTLHVPCIVSGPGVPVGLIRDDPISLVDLEPTLARIFRLPDTAPGRAGRVLRWDRIEEPAPLYGETFKTRLTFGWSELRALRLGPHKLIRGIEDELYDLSSDPGELHQLADEGQATRLGARLDALVGEDTVGGIVEATRGMSPRRRRALDALGYVAGPPVELEPGEETRLPDPRVEIAAYVRRQEALRFRRLGEHWIGQGDPARAVVLLDSAVALSPSSGAYFTRGNIHRALAEQTRSRDDFARSLALKLEEDPTVRIVRKNVLETGKLPTGLSDDDPSLASAIEFLSSIHMARGESDSALVYLRWLARRHPDDERTRYNLGLSAFRTGNAAEAREHLRAYLELAPEGSHAVVVRRLLEEELSGD